VMPGFAQEGSEAVIQVFRVLVFDGGQNGVPDDADDTLLAQQGIYVP
jgi:hypothetical protein